MQAVSGQPRRPSDRYGLDDRECADSADGGTAKSRRLEESVGLSDVAFPPTRHDEHVRYRRQTRITQFSDSVINDDDASSVPQRRTAVLQGCVCSCPRPSRAERT